MSCVVGLKHEGSVYIGADSAGVSGWDIMERADRKVFRSAPFIYGFTSSFRMGQLLQYSLKVPDRHGDESGDQFMCTKFVDAVRECLKAGGYAKKEHDEESAGEFLVGTPWGSLYRVAEDYQVAESALGYDAIGCGSAYALGAMTALDITIPELRITEALAISHKHSAGVRPPFHVEKL